MPRARGGAHTIAYYRQPAEDGSRPGQYYLNTVAPRDPPALRGGGPRLPRVHPGPPPPDRDRAGARRACRRSGATSARRRSSRAGACTRSASPTRWASTRATSTASASSRFDAWRASRLVVDTGMHALGWTRRQAIDFMLEHTALAPEQHRQRGRPLHRAARPGARLQDRPAGAPPAARRGPRAARRRVRHPRLPRHGARERGDRRCRSLRGVVEAWTDEGAAEAATTG